MLSAIVVYGCIKHQMVRRRIDWTSINIAVPYLGSTEKNTANAQYFGVGQDYKCGKSTYNIRFGIDGVIRFNYFCAGQTSTT